VNFSKRESIKALFFNKQNQLLMMLVEDTLTTGMDGKPRGPFWCLVGGGIKEGESMQEAAIRGIGQALRNGKNSD